MTRYNSGAYYAKINLNEDSISTRFNFHDQRNVNPSLYRHHILTGIYLVDTNATKIDINSMFMELIVGTEIVISKSPLSVFLKVARFDAPIEVLEGHYVMLTLEHKIPAIPTELTLFISGHYGYDRLVSGHPFDIR